ncbi:MAG TPA: hypothetical protein VGC78_06815 [Gaiellaceae bacterium]|jgi:uncharacterized repeat protein (TIGR01451 family)
MKPVVLISAVCVLVASAAIGTAAGSTKPLPAPRVDVSGWSAKKTYTIGQAVSYGFAIRNRAGAGLKVVEVRMTLPKGWRLVKGTDPWPRSVKGSAAVWRFTNLARVSRSGSVRRLVLSYEVGGKPGTACFTQTVRGLTPLTAKRTTHGCNKVLDAVFH